MANNALMTKLSQTVHTAGFKIKKHSPEILLVAGVAGVVTSAVMACKATTKVSTILENHKNAVNSIETVVNDPVYAEEYTPEDAKKDLAITHVQTGLEFVKLYGPAVLVGAASIACILASHNIITKRNVALAAAYATVDKGFKEYRGRVIERFGKELDRELKFNIKPREVEETVQNEDGTETTVTKTIQTAEINEISDYARFFCEGCKGWTKNPEDNLYYVRQVENWANDKLRAQKHLYLNEVYDMFGIDRTKAGNIVGWVLNGDGDGFVDFGIYDIHDERKRAFVNGYERNILLDFNVDGNILELMK